jgi:D-alanine-D-alanine ligase
MKINKHIEIVRSGIPGLNYMSSVSCDGILEVLSRQYETVHITVIVDMSDLESVVAMQPDLVFLGTERIPANVSPDVSDPDMIWVAHYLDEHGITYTGSNHLAHQLTRDKSLAKQRMLDTGLTTSPYVVAHKLTRHLNQDFPLTFPVFIKPTNKGGGQGIDVDSVSHNLDQVEQKVQTIAESCNADSLIEEYLEGREFSVAILKDEESDDYAVMPLELVAPPDMSGIRILSSKVKSSNAEQVLPVTDSKLKSAVNDLALQAFMALGARDYGRIDIRLDAQNVPHFLEANLIPSLISGYGSFPKACILNENLPYDDMILRIAYLGLKRSEQDFTAGYNQIISEEISIADFEPTFGAA